MPSSFESLHSLNAAGEAAAGENYYILGLLHRYIALPASLRTVLQAWLTDAEDEQLCDQMRIQPFAAGTLLSRGCVTHSSRNTHVYAGP